MPKAWVVASGHSSVRLAADAVVFVHADPGAGRKLRESSPHHVSYTEVIAVDFDMPGPGSSGHLVVATQRGVQPRRANNPAALSLPPTNPFAIQEIIDFADELLRRSNLPQFTDIPTEGFFRRAKPAAKKTDPPSRTSAPAGADQAATLRFNPPPGWPSPPPGWLPTPGWTPNPSWPPPPAGWQLVTSTTSSTPDTDDTDAHATARHGLPTSGAPEAPNSPGRVGEQAPRAPGAPGSPAQVLDRAPADPGLSRTALLEQHTTSLAGAAAALKAAHRRLKDIQKEMAPAFAALARVNDATHLMSIGTLQRVSLYNWHLKMPRARVPMSTQVHATAENQGVKQVLRGSIWSGPQSADRREMWLHVTWPGGFEAVHWQRNDDSITGALVTPAQVHQMAAAINRTAQRYPDALVEADHRRQAATMAVARVSAALRAEVEALLAQLERHVETATTVWAFTEDLAGRDKLGLRERLTIKDTANRAGTLEGAARQELERGRQMLAQLLPPWPGAADLPPAQRAQLGAIPSPALIQAPASADQRTRSLRALHAAMTQLLEQRRGQPAPTASDTTTANPAQPAAPVDLLRQLAQLRDAGVLTEQEFTDKKTDILNRL